MILRDPFNSRNNTVRWVAAEGRLYDYREWGHVTEEGMVVLGMRFSGRPALQRQVECELGLRVFNGASRPQALNAWDAHGNPVRWTELNHVWMVWDREHDIILPEPAWGTHYIVYPHPLGRPYVSQRYSRIAGEFTLSRANRKRANEWIEFFKLIVMKGRLAGPPERPTMFGLSMLNDILLHCPNLEAVPIDTCQKIVYGLSLQDKILDGALSYVRDAARDKWRTPYLSTRSQGRKP